MSHNSHYSNVSSSIIRQTSTYYLPLYIVNQQVNGASVYGGCSSNIYFTNRIFDIDSAVVQNINTVQLIWSIPNCAMYHSKGINKSN